MAGADGTRRAVACSQCTTPMEAVTLKKYSATWPVSSIGLGLFSSLFLFGPIVGAAMVAFGIYTALAEENVRQCPNCGYYFRMASKGKRLA